MKYMRNIGYLLCAFGLVVSGLSECQTIGTVAERSIVVIIPSYNNAQWYKQNLDSVFAQKYSNFRIIYCEDCWTVGGGLVQQYKDEYDTENRMTLICNDTRSGAMANVYTAVHMCDSNDLVVMIDGDDWFATDQALSIINSYYDDPDVWLTYGAMRSDPDRGGYGRRAIPSRIIKNSSYREYRWVAQQPRTFYAWLFKHIKKEDLLYDGEFVVMAHDVAYMMPMFEMSGGRFVAPKEVLYIYNRMNAINDSKVNARLQGTLNRYIRSLPRYEPLAPIIVRADAI